MNRYPIWKYVIVVLAVLVGLVYALPNVYGEDPAVQISATRTTTMDAAALTRVEDALKAANIPYMSAALDVNGAQLRFEDTESQLHARDVVRTTLGEGFTVALNLLPATPAILRLVRADPMNLGLDLRGGVRFLLEVDLPAAEREAAESFVAQLRTSLREAGVRYRTVDTDPAGGIVVRFQSPEARATGADILYAEFLDLVADDETTEPDVLRLIIKETYLKQIREAAIDQNLVTLRNRVDEFGVAEPVIQKQGEQRIIVQLPGVQDATEAREILGSTATLEFRMVDIQNSVQDALDGRVPVSSALYKERDGNPVLLSRRVMLTGQFINDASSGLEQSTGLPQVTITLDGEGARRFEDATEREVGNPMAVVFIEQRNKRPVAEVINIATIREKLSQRFQITGLDSGEEARTLALLLRAGSLAAPMEIIEETTVGPALGADNIARGFHSIWIGFAAISLFMLVYYLAFGLTAVIALAVNVLLLVALLSMIGVTLTLPGMAAIALTVGMAIDANVLINERIREELRNGNTPQASIHAGYERAFGTILDSNVTTFIAGFALLMFGTGSVQGFAVVLCLGILTSMFSAVMVSRSLVNLWYGRQRKLQRLAIGNTAWQATK